MSLLEVSGLDVHHGQLHAVRSFDLTLEEGRTVAVIGANGAGKSTLLQAVAGARRANAGRVLLDGEDVTSLPAHHRVARGISLVPEGRRLFPSLTVEENLLTGEYRRRPGPWDVAAVTALFPWMGERSRQKALLLSGGQQQAVAIGRALVSNPRVLMVDELSLGLAPSVVAQMYALLPRITERGTAVLLVEQDVTRALAAADHVHCMLEGRSVLEGDPADLTHHDVEQAYFGLADAGRTET